jgi:Flp pilus assembly pilin Flp
MKTLTNIFRTETGQTMTEYAVTLGVITIGIVLALTSLASVTVNTILRVAGFFS